MDAIATQVQSWSKLGDVFAYFMAGAKIRNPAAAQSLLRKRILVQFGAAMEMQRRLVERLCLMAAKLGVQRLPPASWH